MNGEKNKGFPIVRTRFWLGTSDKDVDLSYINKLLGIIGETKRKSEFVPSAKEFARSSWDVKLDCENVVSLEDAMQQLLEPLCEKAEKILELIDAEGLKATVTVAIWYDAQTLLPLLFLSQKTILMLNALHVSEFSIDPYFYGDDE